MILKIIYEKKNDKMCIGIYVVIVLNKINVCKWVFKLFFKISFI